MVIVEPDFARRIDLAGVGPCPRPIDIDRAHTGFADLVSLRVYSFAQDMVIDGEAEGDEVFIVLMRGAADIAVDRARARVGNFALRADGGSRAVYLPPHAAYRLTAAADCDIAYARVQPPRPALPEARSFAPAGNRLVVSDHAAGMELTFATLADGETIALAGRDGAARERFVHVRADDGATAAVHEARIADWVSIILDNDERATLAAEGGKVDVLIVSASSR